MKLEKLKNGLTVVFATAATGVVCATLGATFGAAVGYCGVYGILLGTDLVLDVSQGAYNDLPEEIGYAFATLGGASAGFFGGVEVYKYLSQKYSL